MSSNSMGICPQIPWEYDKKVYLVKAVIWRTQDSRVDESVLPTIEMAMLSNQHPFYGMRGVILTGPTVHTIPYTPEDRVAAIPLALHQWIEKNNQTKLANKAKASTEKDMIFKSFIFS
ncbi:uncharacterized protein MELLADRAFT_101309 [Melampsora larici-populina 98AG31]|uniref:Uncharacterized protein n=1 Tax=Melampsora larici-populina (strain 98AG31 / pathotype 3-4-7) TaxID=747676 RepID=F4R4B3_MELLP|nr:uncharacterized protein MELLADRAFT_101309 [Melampsora larici-populina 98AG31]EGG12781.1 hypothetical protein MELLADRAFT_101309 [Melampsora larici-populina 98AG31]